ncbi:MAG: flagellar export chaperone FlgN [Deltaproteobacteria bacterium]|nr:flagellar export chaperone FlgN [Deltaproteobacteria bacterium]
MSLEALLEEWDGILSEEVEVLSQLIDLYKREREAIIGMDLEGLTVVTKQKHEQILRTQVLETSRRGMTERLGRLVAIPNDVTSERILQAISATALTTQIRHRLSCLRSMAQAVLELNEGQRRYIAHSISGVEASLELLTMLSGGQRYTASGVMDSRERVTSMGTQMNHSV